MIEEEKRRLQRVAATEHAEFERTMIAAQQDAERVRLEAAHAVREQQILAASIVQQKEQELQAMQQAAARTERISRERDELLVNALHEKRELEGERELILRQKDQLDSDQVALSFKNSELDEARRVALKAEAEARIAREQAAHAEQNFFMMEEHARHMMKEATEGAKYFRMDDDNEEWEDPRDFGNQTADDFYLQKPKGPTATSSSGGAGKPPKSRKSYKSTT
jgi:cell division protein FtsL